MGSGTADKNRVSIQQTSSLDCITCVQDLCCRLHLGLNCLTGLQYNKARLYQSHATCLHMPAAALSTCAAVKCTSHYTTCTRR